MNIDITIHEFDEVKPIFRPLDNWWQLSFGDIKISCFDSRFLALLREAIKDTNEEPLEDLSPTCEICLERAYSNPQPATTVEQDAEGNTLQVCEEHAEELASAKPERAADVEYDNFYTKEEG